MLHIKNMFITFEKSKINTVKPISIKYNNTQARCFVTGKNFLPEKDTDIMDDFRLETAENIDRAEKLLAALERDGGREQAGELFRIFHTIKGDAFALELDVLGKTAHSAENMLDLLRKGAVENLRSFSGVLYAFCAMIKEMASFSDEKSYFGESSDGKDGLVLESGQQEMYLKIKPEKARALMSSVLKLSGSVKMIKYAAEKVKNRADEETVFMLKEIENLSHIFPQLFAAVGGINMVSLVPVMKKMENAALAACRASGKKAAFIYNLGADEADRSVAEKISEPLAHIIRNAIGHGIETPEERVIKGKNPEGRIILNTYSDEGNFFVSVQDDGKGISAEDIIDKAVKTGAAEPGSIPDNTGILKIITHPGFSTASGINSVSGRGVGLDVVRRYVEGLRGNLSLKTKKGEGSTFIIRLPASINVIDAVKAEINGKFFLLPEAYVSSVMCVFESNIVHENGSDFIYSGGEKIKCVKTARVFGGIRQPSENSRVFCVLLFEGLKAALECGSVPVTESCMTAAVECVNLKKTYYSGAAFDKRGVPVLIADCVKIINEVNNGN